MNIDSIVREAIQTYSVLHQQSEMFSCLQFLQDKQLNGFIEIGSAHGASFHCWASVIPSGPKISIDLNHGFSMSDGLPDANTDKNTPAAGEHEYISVKTRNDKWRSHFTDVRIVEGNSMAQETVDATRKVLNGELVDWLFIDGWHEEYAARADFNNYKQFVSTNGFIGFHDIGQSDSMIAFWKSMCTEYPHAFDLDGAIGIVPLLIESPI